MYVMDPPKIFIISVPIVGHYNQILPLVTELVKEHRAKVVLYSFEKFKFDAEKSGAEFRAYDKFNYKDIVFKLPAEKRTRRPNLFLDMINKLEPNIPKIAKAIDEEKPDLVLYDAMAFHAKWIMQLIETNYIKADRLKEKAEYDEDIFIPSSPPPPALIYCSNFVHQKNVYPNQIEAGLINNIGLREKLYLFTHLSKSLRKSKSICKNLGIEYKNPFDHLFDAKLPHIVFTCPDVHPRSDKFNKNFVFVGASIDETVHKNGLAYCNSHSIKSILKNYPPINPLMSANDIKKINDKKLILVSLGTVVNNNLPLYKKIIDAFQTFDQEPLRNYKANEVFDNIDVIITVGNECQESINLLVKAKELILPPNIIIVPSAPQLDLLKRASLFITHAGIASVNEAIHYGVPMICLPYTANEILIAHRISKELGIGINLDFLEVDSSIIRANIHRALQDRTLFEQSIYYSQLSHEYNGQKLAANLIMKKIALNRKGSVSEKKEQNQQ